MRSTPLLIVFAALLSASSAAGQDVVSPSPEELAETLGIVGTDEAVILIVGTESLGGLVVGGREIVPAPAAEDGLYQVVRKQPEGIVSVTLTRGDLSWEGQVRTFAGQVTVVDAEASFRSPEATDAAAAVQDEEFDLFAFYDALDERTSDADKLQWCAEVLAGELGEADRTVVTETCSRLEAAAAADAAGDEILEDEDLTAALLDDADLELQGGKDQSITLLYRKDGRPRIVARGTTVRWIVVGGAAVATGISTYSALFWEYRAEQEYAVFRQAERVGDDAAMTRHLFYSRTYDRNRDVSIGVGTAFLTGTIVAVVIQALEGRRFRRQRAALEASVP